MIHSHSLFNHFLLELAKMRLTNLSPESTVYIAALMEKMAKADLDNANPFAIQLLSVANNKNSAAADFAKIGDSILFFSGVFKDGLLSDEIGLRYYYSLGQIAYRSASNLSSRDKDLYANLSRNFEEASGCIYSLSSPLK